MCPVAPDRIVRAAWEAPRQILVWVAARVPDIGVKVSKGKHKSRHVSGSKEYHSVLFEHDTMRLSGIEDSLPVTFEKCLWKSDGLSGTRFEYCYPSDM